MCDEFSTVSTVRLLSHERVEEEVPSTGEDEQKQARMRAEQLLKRPSKKKGTDMKSYFVIKETFMENRYAEGTDDPLGRWSQLVFSKSDRPRVEDSRRLSNWSKIASGQQEPSVSLRPRVIRVSSLDR